MSQLGFAETGQNKNEVVWSFCGEILSDDGARRLRACLPSGQTFKYPYRPGALSFIITSNLLCCHVSGTSCFGESFRHCPPLRRVVGTLFETLYLSPGSIFVWNELVCLGTLLASVTSAGPGRGRLPTRPLPREGARRHRHRHRHPLLLLPPNTVARRA